MFFTKFFYFLKGYVIIEISGNLCCRLISVCAEKGIKLYNITRGEKTALAMLQTDFYDFYVLAADMGVKITVKKICDAREAVLRYRKRLGFAAGMIMFVLFYAVSSQFLWDIRIQTDGNIKSEEVLEVLAEIGIKRGAVLKDIPDGRTVKNHIINSFDNVPWAWIYINGIRATVSIHEGIVPPVVVNEDEPCDIIASKDGFIVSASIKRGEQVVLPGNAVNAGDLLVSGNVKTGPDGTGRMYTVHSEGEIMALTRYEREAEYKLWENVPVFSGNEKNIYEFSVFSKSLRLFKEPDYDFSIRTEEDIFSFGNVGIKRIKYEEAEHNRVQLPEDSVVEFAKRDLSAQIAEKLGKNARLQSEEYTVSKNADSVTVKAEMVFTEDIGVAVPG